MTEDKSFLDQFLASIWGKISAFMTSVIALAGFAALWKENFIVVGAITFGLVTAILALASFGWRTELAQPAILTKRPLSARRKRVPLLPANWLLAARIALGSAMLGWVSWGVHLVLHVENLQPDKIAVFGAGETIRAQAAIAALDFFTFQQDVSTQMAALVLFISGYARFQVEDYPAALERFDRAIAQPSWAGEVVNRADALFFRGLTHFFLENWEQALDDYAKAILLDPHNAMIYNNRSLLYMFQGQYAQAAADASEAIRIDPDEATYYNNRGSAYSAQGQYPEAFSDYAQAIVLSPQDSSAYYNRANTYRAQGQYDKATADYGEAIRLDPAFAAAYDNRGNAYKAQGKVIQAMADYGEAIRLAPNIATAYYNRGNAYHALGQYPRVVADYSEALRLAPEEAGIYFNRAIVYQLNGQDQLALADYQQALHLTANADCALKSNSRSNHFRNRPPPPDSRKIRALHCSNGRSSRNYPEHRVARCNRFIFC